MTIPYKSIKKFLEERIGSAKVTSIGKVFRKWLGTLIPFFQIELAYSIKKTKAVIKA